MRNVLLVAALGSVVAVGCSPKAKAPPAEDATTASVARVAQAGPPPPAPADATEEAAPLAPLAAPVGAISPGGNPVIVHIVSRDKTVTISAGRDGLLYSMKGADGKFAIAEATGAEFEKLEPQLYRSIRNYVAADADDAPLPADAGMQAVPISIGGETN